ncbi:MAG: 3-oxoacyl-[acyl-carrier-protein] reductase [Candidatus Omnitrophica bacterium]|nr:3-oxoacyl-[acyl-carrier-protein] reductase [Candidatus Omnitrophota bacterium]
MRLAGKTALVTGATRGIGREIALTFAREGAQVAVCGRTADALAALKPELEAGGGRPALTFPVDVSQAAPVEAMVANVLDKWGKLDILVNNAGIARDALLVRMSADDWEQVLAVNLTGTFLCTRAVARTMMRQRSGCIINLASVVGLMGNPGQANYAASKAAIIGLTKSVARELGGRGVTVNAIAPGFIETEMTGSLSEAVKTRWKAQIPLGEFGHPRDVAAAAVFLASDAARYITGQVLQVDGGLVT